MRFILIGIFLTVSIVAFIGYIRAPTSSNIEIFGTRISIFGIENSVEEELNLLRQRRTTLYAARRLRYNPFSKKPISKLPKHHKHRRERYSFILRCPKLSPSLNTVKFGVEWSLNSTGILRILSNGRRYENIELTEVEEWRGINGKLNVIAFGPKPEKRYKFELEEARGWFSFRIHQLKIEDIGEWKCLIRAKIHNGTILEFESRKKAHFKNVKTGTSHTNVEDDTAITYSDAPLFSFSKNDGEITVFSRVDRSRDLLSYVRSFDDNEVPKAIYVEPKSAIIKGRKSKNSAYNNRISSKTLLILWCYILKVVIN